MPSCGIKLQQGTAFINHCLGIYLVKIEYFITDLDDQFSVFGDQKTFNKIAEGRQHLDGHLTFEMVEPFVVHFEEETAFINNMQQLSNFCFGKTFPI
ncbi:hypothetical protein KUH03_07890 [Sphingobacterium sp. E70]|uniref:hypothetical protein n=1 Tax=Sphingobacterium sp. E70 TaxID=2853439 RepID=UPI00211D0C93|nr:hypothetical protein [Sphingobacterium sp. E70]ULT26743.1 hypothetical protein KUH03_07890 [Sphingobacterium sp. E70]